MINRKIDLDAMLVHSEWCLANGPAQEDVAALDAAVVGHPGLQNEADYTPLYLYPAPPAIEKPE